MKVSARMTGADELVRSLHELAGAVDDLTDPVRDAAGDLAAQARAKAPRKTGRLASTIKVADGGPAGATVTVGTRYARPALARRYFLPTERTAEQTAGDAIDSHIAGVIRRERL